MLLPVLFLCACNSQTETAADMVLQNGQVYTVNKDQPNAEALAVKDGIIIFTGTNKEVKKYIGKQTELIDCKGLFVMPGFIEGHGHIYGLGSSLVNLNLMHVEKWDEIVAMVADAVKKAKPGDWIIGRGWHQEKFDPLPEPNVAGFPLHDTLSAVSPDNPVKVTIQTTRGFKPKDYEMIQAIVGMWRKVGIEAEIEVYEIAKHYELRAADQLAPAAFYNWGNAIGDPTTSTGFAMYGPSPHSVWDGQDVIDAINPLWGEADEEKRIAGWKAVSKLIADNAYVLPLIQYAQPIVHAKGVNVVPHKSGALLPALMTPAS